MATYRLEQTAPDRVARMLSAWSVSSSATIAALTALWGVLAAVTSPRAGIGIAGALLLATPLVLPRPRRLAAAEEIGDAKEIGDAEKITILSARPVGAAREYQSS
jgi:hypothetical protein